MAFWDGELRELGNLYESFKGHLPDIVKELEQLVRTDDPNVVMLYSRRCLEVIITDLCENELKRPRKTEPLKGIIDKLNAEEKVPSHIITSMLSLNSMANYGAHPKDFDPEQVKPVLNNLAIIIKWYLKYKDFRIVSKAGTDEIQPNLIEQIPSHDSATGTAPVKARFLNPFRIVLLIILALLLALIFLPGIFYNVSNVTNDKPVAIPVDPSRQLFTDPVNMDVYSEIKIGSQVWMGENLKAEKFNDGTPVPFVKEQSEWASTSNPAFCWYNNNEKYYKASAYGALYNWHAVNTGKLCPSGWHVPTAAEWDTLARFLDPEATLSEDGYHFSQKAGIKMKFPGNSFWLNTDTVFGTNESGFGALPGGYRNTDGYWELGTVTGWWSSTAVEGNPGYAYDRNIREVIGSIFDRGPDPKNSGSSVRCIKNKINSDI